MLGILGGTFDPIHYGHLRPAAEVQRALQFDELRVIPAANPPHRPPPAAAAMQRLAMVRLAIADMPGFVADDRELRRAGPSYTVPTLESLRQEFPGESLCLLVGADAFAGLQSWHRWHRIPELAHLVVMRRPHCTVATADWVRARRARDAEELRGSPAGLVWFQPVTLQDISGRRLRGAVAAGASIAGLVPPAVWGYIQEHRIYRPVPGP